MLPCSVARIPRLALLGLLATGAARVSAEPAVPVLPDFTPVAWLPAARSALLQAAAAGDGVAVAPAGSVHRKGDSITVLVQATEGRSLRQWAVVLAINDIKPEEQKLRTPAFSLYLSNGHQVDFAPSAFTGMLIHVLGPFSDAPGAHGATNVWSGSLVSPLFLGLGLEGAAALSARIDRIVANHPALRAQPISFGISSRPFSREQIAIGRPTLEPYGLSADEERSYAGLMPALNDFFRIAAQTPGVRDILFEALDLPWWSIITHGGRVKDVHFDLAGPYVELSPANWGLPPDLRVYAMGLRLTLNGKPALHCRLAVTQPRVPLLNSAGIVGIAAMRPNGKGPHLMIRVMAARPAGDPN